MKLRNKNTPFLSKKGNNRETPKELLDIFFFVTFKQKLKSSFIPIDNEDHIVIKVFFFQDYLQKYKLLSHILSSEITLFRTYLKCFMTVSEVLKIILIKQSRKENDRLVVDAGDLVYVQPNCGSIHSVYRQRYQRPTFFKF